MLVECRGAKRVYFFPFYQHIDKAYLAFSRPYGRETGNATELRPPARYPPEDLCHRKRHKKGHRKVSAPKERTSEEVVRITVAAVRTSIRQIYLSAFIVSSS